VRHLAVAFFVYPFFQYNGQQGGVSVRHKNNNLFVYCLIFSVIIIDLIIFYSLMKTLNVWEKEITAAIIGFIGSIIGGVLTLLGVKMTLVKQNDKDEEDKERHKHLLFAQIKYTYLMFKQVPNAASIVVEYIIYDKNWNERLYHVSELDEKEYKDIVAWFHVLSQLEIMAQRKDGYVTTHEVKVLINSSLPKIQRLLVKHGYLE
jgi:NADH:ubiquinone oxidoreductase subunit 5 (subunit L)/multisubunit Na+/H+ antiporter MnhA subunit